MKVDRKEFGSLSSGEKVTLFTLTNSKGHSVQLIDYGAILVSVNVPDRSGAITNVTAGFKDLSGYLNRHPYFGATVGRFCNRIAKGKFTIDGHQYTLATNAGGNHLHGGAIGFDKQMWKAEEASEDGSKGIQFSLTSPDGQEGYPGTLKVTAYYGWSDDDLLTIHFKSTTDKATHINLTNHMYLNLGGEGSGKITDHILTLTCDKYLPIDDGSIPLGTEATVDGTPFDFRTPHTIGERIGSLNATSGYDHCYVVNGAAGKLRECAKVVDPKTGRAFELKTTQPGVQLYTGNFLSGNSDSANYKQHEAFCLETQHFPDAPNQPNFLTTLLEPGKTAEEVTTMRFYVVPE